MNQQGAKKRTIISFTLAIATALLSIYIQNYTDHKMKEKELLETQASPAEKPTIFVETIH